MPPTSRPDGPARPAAVVNDLIRALFARVGGRLYGADRVEYERLRDEWVQAVARERDPPRIEVVEAA